MFIPIFLAAASDLPLPSSLNKEAVWPRRKQTFSFIRLLQVWMKYMVCYKLEEKNGSVLVGPSILDKAVNITLMLRTDTATFSWWTPHSVGTADFRFTLFFSFHVLTAVHRLWAGAQWWFMKLSHHCSHRQITFAAQI